MSAHSKSARTTAQQMVDGLPMLCTREECAKLFRTTTRNISKWISAGRLRSMRVVERGKSQALIPRTDVERLLAECLGDV